MATSDNITYAVLIRDQGDWQAKGSSGDMQTALAAANDMFATNRFSGVKVQKTFYDDQNQRFVTTTILERAGQARSTMSLPFLVVLALLGGLVSFGITYMVAIRYL